MSPKACRATVRSQDAGRPTVSRATYCIQSRNPPANIYYTTVLWLDAHSPLAQGGRRAAPAARGRSRWRDGDGWRPMAALGV